MKSVVVLAALAAIVGCNRAIPAAPSLVTGAGVQVSRLPVSPHWRAARGLSSGRSSWDQAVAIRSLSGHSSCPGTGIPVWGKQNCKLRRVGRTRSHTVSLYGRCVPKSPVRIRTTPNFRVFCA